MMTKYTRYAQFPRGFDSGKIHKLGFHVITYAYCALTTNPFSTDGKPSNSNLTVLIERHAYSLDQQPGNPQK